MKSQKTTKSKKTETDNGYVKPETVVISVLVDESGSMSSVYEPTMAGFNEYVESLQRELKDQAVYFSAIKFDTAGVRKLQVGAPIVQAIKLTKENYQPNGGTPLLDAIGKTVLATDEVAGKHRAQKIIVVIQTDGEENSSTEYNLPQIKTMIEERQGKGWQFVFLGAGINAFADATKMGIVTANTMSYGATATGTTGTFRATSQNSARFAKGLASNMNYSAAQSLDSEEDPAITAQKLASTAATKMNPAYRSSSLSNLSLDKE